MTEGIVRRERGRRGTGWSKRERETRKQIHTQWGWGGGDYYDTLGQKPAFKEKNWLHHMIGKSSS